MLSGGCTNSEPFALQVVDDSMEPEFTNGCVITIDPSGVATHGTFVLAEVKNGYIFRQLVRMDDAYYLQPLNQSYQHEKHQIEFSAIKGIIIQKASPCGRRKAHKHYF